MFSNFIEKKDKIKDVIMIHLIKLNEIESKQIFYLNNELEQHYLFK